MRIARIGTVCAIALLGVISIAGCGGGDEEATRAPTPSTPSVDAATGKEIAQNVAEPSCGQCHTLADAEFSGRVGPNLDNLQPDESQVYSAITTGPGTMPNYSGQLSEQQLRDVAAYIARASGN